MNREEHFTVTAFRHLEALLHRLRVQVMNRAAELADRETDAAERRYNVTAEHIDRALSEVTAEKAKKGT